MGVVFSVVLLQIQKISTKKSSSLFIQENVLVIFCQSFQSSKFMGWKVYMFLGLEMTPSG